MRLTLTWSVVCVGIVMTTPPTLPSQVTRTLCPECWERAAMAIAGVGDAE